MMKSSASGHCFFRFQANFFQGFHDQGLLKLLHEMDLSGKQLDFIIQIPESFEFTDQLLRARDNESLQSEGLIEAH